jgi:hypothetical protein
MTYRNTDSLDTKAHPWAFRERSEKTFKAFRVVLQPAFWLKDLWMVEDISIVVESSYTHPNHGLRAEIRGRNVMMTSLPTPQGI